MSVYDRTERSITLALSRTAPIVGPGSYDVDKPDREKYRKDGYAPFNSLTSRIFQIGGDPEAPGPGQYDAVNKSPQKSVASLKSQTARFHDKVSTVPGPGTYDTKELTLVDAYNGRKSENSLSKGFSSDKDVLIYKNIRFERKYNVPSIPVPSQSHGYEEGVNGTLVRQAPPERDVSLGPAYYKINDSVDATPQNAVKYKGIHWGKMRSKRESEAEAAKKAAVTQPGPGTYEIPSFIRSTSEIPGSKSELKIKRFIEGVVEDSKKKGGPGPGWYNMKSTFEQKAQTATVTDEGAGPVDKPPFMSTESRFKGENRVLHPGPGSYSDPRTAFESLRKPTALKRQPFGQTTARFGERHSAGPPGPAAYQPVGDMARESLKKAFVAASQKGGFGSTATRSNAPTEFLRDTIEVPGPGHYDPKTSIAAAPRYVQMSSTFASTSKRESDFSVDKSVPPPGSYDVSHSYKAMFDRKSIAKPRTDDAWRRQSSFGVSAARWRSESDVRAPIPGPGQYDTNTNSTAAINTNKGRSMPRDSRFKYGKSLKLPGPADYTLSPLMQDTVLKGTFNVTLGQAQLVK